MDNIIWLISFYDGDAYCAYRTVEKAKEVLWQMYCDDVAEEDREKYYEEDQDTLHKYLYIEDYGYIESITLVEE